MGIDMSAIKELTAAIDGRRAERQPTVARARVVQADGGGTWVQVDGGASRTPVASSTVAVAQGDEVMVRIDGGKATVTGNVSRPSTDDSAADELRESMEPIVRRVADAEGSISEVRQDADSLRTRVETAEGDISSMEQTAEGWTFISQMRGATSTAQATANSARGDAAEAAKTATSFMSFKNGSLSVGQMDAAGDPVGYSSVIKGTGGFAIRDASKEVWSVEAEGDGGGNQTMMRMTPYAPDGYESVLYGGYWPASQFSAANAAAYLSASSPVGECGIVAEATSSGRAVTVYGGPLRIGNRTLPTTCYGRASASNVAGGSYQDVGVSFGYTYSEKPVVTCNVQNNDSSAYSNHHGVEVHDVTTSGCKIRVHNANASTAISPSIAWVAVGV